VTFRGERRIAMSDAGVVAPVLGGWATRRTEELKRGACTASL
jgi:hypothetical protein